MCIHHVLVSRAVRLGAVLLATLSSGATLGAQSSARPALAASSRDAVGRSPAEARGAPPTRSGRSTS
jgi:hypothetical protein